MSQRMETMLSRSRTSFCPPRRDNNVYESTVYLLLETGSLWTGISELGPAWQSWILLMVEFHLLCFAFEVCDQMKFLERYKVFRATQNTPTYVDMLPTVLRNQIFLLLPVMLVCEHSGFTYTGSQTSPPEFSTRLTTIANTVFCCAVASALHEVMFYITHRYILHTFCGFEILDHRLHHQSRAHSAVSAMYMSAPDFVLEIILPYIVPLWVISRLGTSWLTIAILPLGALGGLYEHSGYRFFSWKALDTTAHGLHHLYMSCSYADGVGATNVLDEWFGTACTTIFGMSRLFPSVSTRRKSV